MFRQNTKTPSDEKFDAYISDTIIHHPRMGYTYRLKFYSHEAVISFTGNGLKDCCYFDISTGSFLMDQENMPHQIRWQTLYLISNKVLSNEKLTLPMPIIYNPVALDFYAINRIDIELKNTQPNEYSVNISINATPLKAAPPDNQFILSMVKKFLPEMKLEVGQYPILLKKNRPSYDFLVSLYKRFMRFNDKSKLDYQYANMNGKCHMRAYFVNRMLDEYEIQSFKIFKFWNNPVDAWKKFDNEAWSFHCAAMIIDQENNMWIWDPWVGYNKKLLTPREWIYRSDEPIPNSVMLTSSWNIIQYKLPDLKIEYHFPHIMTDGGKADISTLQAAFSSAIPNPPEFPLKGVVSIELQALRRLGLFGEKNQKPKNAKLLLDSGMGKSSDRPGAFKLVCSARHLVRR